MKSAIGTMLLMALFAAIPAGAQSAAPKGEEHSGHHAAAPAADSVEGEVRKIDKEAGKITLKHGPIPNLDMPAMSMVFRVKDAAMLDAVRVGDKIRFKADKLQGALTVTEITTMP